MQIAGGRIVSFPFEVKSESGCGREDEGATTHRRRRRRRRKRRRRRRRKLVTRYSVIALTNSPNK